MDQNRCVIQPAGVRLFYTRACKSLYSAPYRIVCAFNVHEFAWKNISPNIVLASTSQLDYGVAQTYERAMAYDVT